MNLGCILLLALPPQGPSSGHPSLAPHPTPNVLMIVLDDVGMDMFGGLYQEVPDAPVTPQINRLAMDGLFFRNAWANPYCSPTRATLMTGRYGFRTGIGTYIDGTVDSFGLRVGEVTLPERLREAGYSSAALGKWHLAVKSIFGAGQGLRHPLNSGFDLYRGAMFNPTSPPIEANPPACAGPLSYYHWVKNTDGVQDCTRTYMTADTVDDALAFLQAPGEPWFLYLAFNAAHAPFHDPTGRLPTSATDRAKCKAMVEFMDGEIGRLLAAAAYPDPDLYVILVGDNGTETWVAFGRPSQGGCFGTAHSKGSLYEGGVNVPLIIAGPRVVPRETQLLANTTDLFATVCDLAGLDEQSEDSRSLVPLLFGSEEPVRDFVYAEKFGPNGVPFNRANHERAVCDGRYKLIRRTSGGVTRDELFDLGRDPCETVNLLPASQASPADRARVRLEGYLRSLGVH